MDNGRPPTDIPVKPTYKYVLIRGFRSMVHSAGSDVESRTLLRTTGQLIVRTRRRRSKNRIGLLVTIVTRLTLKPIDITSSVDHHIIQLRRCTQPDSRKILSASLRYTRSNRSR
ncbi:hypothetical protein HanRHA438_Chr14g0635111 [Helianthus annuus]|nr:hypothetical protein HanRHA438_Chr14g0635111 [Helianthus annuus]